MPYTRGKFGGKTVLHDGWPLTVLVFYWGFHYTILLNPRVHCKVQCGHFVQTCLTCVKHTSFASNLPDVCKLFTSFASYLPDVCKLFTRFASIIYQCNNLGSEVVRLMPLDSKA